MSEEDLERYEAEIELALVQEYRTVLPLFNYVVESERRFYLANEVKVTVRDGIVTDLCRARVGRCLGVGHVPPRPLRSPCARPHVPGRERGTASRPRQLMAGPSRRAALGGRGEDAAVAWYRSASYEILDRNWRCAEGELDVVAQSADGAVLVFCEVKTRSSERLRLALRGGRPGQAAPGPQAGDACGCAVHAAGRACYEHIRFDVAAVTRGAGGALEVEVLQDAF